MVAYAKFLAMDSNLPEHDLDLSHFETEFDQDVLQSIYDLEMRVEFLEDCLLWISEIVENFTCKKNSIVDPDEYGLSRLNQYDADDISGRLMFEGAMFRAKFSDVISIASAFFVLEDFNQTNMVTYSINALMGALIAFKDNWEAQAEESKSTDIIAIADHFLKTSSYEESDHRTVIFDNIMSMVRTHQDNANPPESDAIVATIVPLDSNEKFLLLIELLSIVSEVNMTNCHNFTENTFDEFNIIFFEVLISKLKEHELFT